MRTARKQTVRGARSGSKPRGKQAKRGKVAQRPAGRRLRELVADVAADVEARTHDPLMSPEPVPGAGVRSVADVAAAGGAQPGDADGWPMWAHARPSDVPAAWMAGSDLVAPQTTANIRRAGVDVATESLGDWIRRMLRRSAAVVGFEWEGR